MTAAAAASNRSLRRLQFRSRTASRLSASRLVKRSSPRAIGSEVCAASASMNAITRDGLIVRGTVETGGQADDDRPETVLFRRQTFHFADHARHRVGLA